MTYEIKEAVVSLVTIIILAINPSLALGHISYRHFQSSTTETSSSGEIKKDQSADSLHIRLEALDGLIKDEKNQEALDSAKKLCTTALSLEKWDLYLSGLLIQAQAKTGLLDFEDAEILLDSALLLTRKLLGQNHEITASAHYFLGDFHASQGNYLIALEHAQKSFELRKVLLGEYHVKTGQSLNNVAAIVGYLGDFDREIELLKQSIAIKKKTSGEYSDAMAIGYNNLAVAYRSRNDFSKALEYIERVIEIDTKTLPSDHPILAQDYNVLSAIYLSLNRYDDALAALDKALQINLKRFGSVHRSVATNINNIAAIYGKLGLFEKQLDYFYRSLDIRKKLYGEDHFLVAQIHSNLGTCFTSLRRFDEAKIQLSIALKKRSQTLGERHYSLALIYNKLSLMHIKNNRFDLALEQSQLALGILDSTYNMERIESQPEIKKVAAQKLLLDALKNKAVSLENLKGERDEDTLQLSLETNLVALSLIEDIRMGFDSKLSDNILLDQTYDLYEKSVNQCMHLAEKKQDGQWVEKAFEVSEMARSFRLSKALKESSAKKFARVPDSLLNQEFFLKNLITKDLRSIERGKDQNQIDNLKKRVFSYKRSLDQLTSQLEKDFSKYYRLKYQADRTSIADVQSHLEEGELLLEFFVSDTAIYSFVISKEQSVAHRTSKGAIFDYYLNNFRKSTSDYFFIQDSSAVADKMYLGSATSLYTQLMRDPLDVFSGHTDQITIIPDGSLGLVNFEALLASSSGIETPVNYRKLDYLINHYVINLSPSANVYIQTKRSENRYKSIPDNLYAGFSPSYEQNLTPAKSRDATALNYIPLAGTKEEIIKVSEIFNGSTFFDSTATESKFKEVASNYQLLHLAMHGIIDDRSNHVQLVFEKEKGSEDGLLRIPEIYNLNLNADMVLLSACHGGFGEVQKGEGLMNLSRAFLYAGASSVIVSLWALSDDIAPGLIANFSKYLLQGEQRNVALNLAKTEHIKNATNKFYAHPYFWAGLVPVGDNSEIEFKQSSNLSLWLITAVILLLILAFIFRGRLGLLL